MMTSYPASGRMTTPKAPRQTRGADIPLLPRAPFKDSVEALGWLSKSTQPKADKIGILYDDAYGLWTEEDQASAAAEAFALMDQPPKRHEPA